MHATMPTDTQPPEFDAGNWVKMARFAVAAGVVLSAVTVAILLMVDSPKQCPRWTALWEMLAMLSAPLLVMTGFVAIRWNWVARRAAKYQRRKLLFERLFGPMILPAIPVTYFMVILCIAGSLLSQLPLFALVTQCTDWLRR
jgi:hypothetical protein